MNNSVEVSNDTRILEGPPIWETVCNGLVAIHSHPLLLLFWLVTSSAVVLFNRLTLPLVVKAPLYIGSGIFALLLTSGIMGSMELILRDRGWILPAVWECAKFYFPRFIQLGLIVVTIFFIIYVPLSVVCNNIGPPYFESKDDVDRFLAVVTIVGLLILVFFMTFSGSSIVIGNLLPLESIERSFRIVMTNRLKVLYLWFIFVGTAAAVELIFNKFLDVEWKGKLLQNAILSYIILMMMMCVMYFNYTVTSRGEFETEYEE